jgi:uncharacterized SAM-binding protein YcdF (DUF218 family)/cyclophilin family peptidyl-prolyl cis-trans isomerase
LQGRYGLRFGALVLPQAIVVLGCRIDANGLPSDAAQRRVLRAARAFHAQVAPLIVVAGGRTWHGVPEAQALRHALVNQGVPNDSIFEESWSLNTTENARCVAYLLSTLAIERVAVVTCDWHMPRALHCFRRVGLTVEALPAASPPVSPAIRQLRTLRERLSLWLSRFALLVSLSLAFASGCRQRPQASPSDAASPNTPHSENRPAPGRLVELSRLEAVRDSEHVTTDDLTSRDVAIRRRAAQALARIADDRALELLNRALADEDAEVVLWAAYGLGYTCKGREPSTVRALAMRMAALAAEVSPPSSSDEARDGALCDALARCGGPEAEHSLRARLSGPTRPAEQAALALGRLSTERKRLDDSTLVALLDAAARPKDPLPSALFPFTRLGQLSDALAERLLGVATPLLAKPGPGRVYAVRALGHAGPNAAPELARILESTGFAWTERADAARELGSLGEPGQAALLSVLPKIVPPEAQKQALLTSDFGVIWAAFEALHTAPPDAEPLLRSFASYPLPAQEPGPLGRRIVLLRCAAARALAGTRSLHQLLVACDPNPKGRTGLLATLEVLGRAKIRGERYERWLAIANASDPVVGQAALRLISAHPEINAPLGVISKALADDHVGTVATAARVLANHPDRAAASAKPDASLLHALERAFAKPRPSDTIETRVALVDAAAALQLLSFKPKIEVDCRSPSPSLREHAEKALRLLGESRKVCDSHPPYPEVPAEFGSSRPKSYDLRFVTDAGELRLRLQTDQTPWATTRIAELARAGFYDGQTIHRVVPGFVVQFGDPGGDGFGGAGKPPLPCETSPTAFEPLSVGVALSGRDTGSSQIFVTLGPQPHLSGNYARIGSAEPGWERLALGDVIRKVEVIARP